MGMSIEESKDVIELRGVNIEGYIEDDDLSDALDMALEIMTKYQKIEDIANKRVGRNLDYLFYEIVKVVEDGDDD